MTLRYKGFYLHNHDNWQPEDLTDFGCWADFYIGNDRGSDAFTVLICTPSWFFRGRGAAVTSGRNVIFMPSSDLTALDNFLKAECDGEIGMNHDTTMLKIDGIGD